MEHLAGKGIDHVLRVVHSRRMRAWMDGAPFEVRGHLKRFSLVANAVAGREMRVVDLKGGPRPAPYLPILKKMAHPGILAEFPFAWCDGETIYLPKTLIDLRTGEEQELGAVRLVFFLASQAGRGSLGCAFKARSELLADRLTADLFWIIENTRIHGLLASEYPGLFRGWDSALERLLSRRPPERVLTYTERRVEKFFISSLTGGDGADTAPGSADESLALAREMKARWADDGHGIKGYRAFVPFSPWGRLVPGRLVDPDSIAAKPAAGVSPDEEQPTKKDPERNRPESAKERDRYMTTPEDVDEDAKEQGLLLNIYDKVMSWAEFVNVDRPFDDSQGEDEEKKADDMEELSTASLKRSTTSRFDAELERAGGAAEEPVTEANEESTHVYPEWDFRKAAYKSGFVRLTELDAPAGEPGYVEGVLARHAGIVKEVRRKFEMLCPDSRLKWRSTDGERIDIDAAVQAAVDLKAGGHPDDKLYLAHRNDERDLSALFLVDLSMSTDAWVKDKRVIDHEKEALVVLSESLERLRDRYAVYGFSGKTRKGCKFLRIKGFGEPFASERVRSRVGGLIPYEYTRMGPAVRHAVEILKKESSKLRLLFIITDGKPNDVDVYEGRYGIEDTRRAVAEASGLGILPFCLTVDTSAGEHLEKIFGKGNHAVLSGVDRLIRKLPELYARIIRGM